MGILTWSFCISFFVLVYSVGSLTQTWSDRHAFVNVGDSHIEPL